MGFSSTDPKGSTFQSICDKSSIKLG